MRELINIVILDAKTLGNDIDLEPIKALGHTVIYELTDSSEVEERIRHANVILTNKVILGEHNLHRASQLKMIGLFATGFNNIDLEYAKKRGIGVANVAGYSTRSVAQHTFAMLFQLLEQLSFYDAYVKSKAYVKNDTFAYIEKSFYEIAGKTWGIVGMGAIGQEVARIAHAFGAEVVYYSTSGKNNEMPFKQVDFETILKKSDILSIHAPLNEKTYGLIGYKEICKMKNTAILMNLGRGNIIEEEGLAKALNEQCIRGAALDVLAKEPISENNPLYTVDCSKWLVTPHIGWASIEARTLLVEEVAENIRFFFKGEQRNRLV